MQKTFKQFSDIESSEAGGADAQVYGLVECWRYSESPAAALVVEALAAHDHRETLHGKRCFS